MADFGSTKYNVSFEEWHELLRKVRISGEILLG